MTVEMRWHGRRVKAASRHAVRKAVAAGLEHMLAEANRTVPHELGPLEQSGGVHVDPGGEEGAVAYDTPYARRQHEELTWRHDPGRRAKWLELTWVEQADDALAIMGARLRREMGR